jgi:hypothetical protein
MDVLEKIANVAIEEHFENGVAFQRSQPQRLRSRP